ncbi:hypothetical protein PybrP1_002378 [[Pythium] brassicae (nom. inval.)]|nr:hypothetical protein PybrP1_002378 [[Pythium] brassicae (nom. inval.)]
MGAAASVSATGEIVVGDVVTIQVTNYPKRVIGDDLCSVQVSNVEVICRIPRAEVQRIACWSDIEDGDIVKVREEGSRLYHEATVVAKHDDGSFRVRFQEDEEDEVEDRVEPERVIKLMSGRLEQKEWMMYKETADAAAE